jgi:cell division protein FtsN
MSKNKNRNQNNQNTEVENKEVVVDQPSTEEELENAKIGMPEKVDEMTESVDEPVEEVPVQEEPVVEEPQDVLEAAEEVHEEAEVVEEDDANTRGYYVRLNIRCNLVDKMNTILASIGAKEVSMYDFDFVSGPYKTNEEAQEVSKKIIAKGIRVLGIAECTE